MSHILKTLRTGGHAGLCLPSQVLLEAPSPSLHPHLSTGLSSTVPFLFELLPESASLTQRGSSHIS